MGNDDTLVKDAMDQLRQCAGKWRGDASTLGDLFSEINLETEQRGLPPEHPKRPVNRGLRTVARDLRELALKVAKELTRLEREAKRVADNFEALPD